MSNTLDLNIEGMTCADCVRQVTQAVKDVPGVEILEVGIGTAKLEVEDSSAADAVLAAIGGTGFKPSKA